MRVAVVFSKGALSPSLRRIAEVALAFGDPVSIGDDVVWVDVEGSARLFGGEVALATGLHARVSEIEARARVVIAGTPRGAAALARFGREAVRVIPPGGDGEALLPLPLAALPLTEDQLEWLARLGVRRVRELARLPRKSLTLRLGGDELLALLDGRGETPLVPYQPPEVIEETVELEDPVSSLEPLRFVLKMLCDRLAARLQGRRSRVARLALLLGEERIELTLATALAESAALVGVLCTKLERHVGEEHGEIRRVTLIALELTQRIPRMLDLFTPEPVTRAALPRLYAELVCELGAERVGCLTLRDRWSPESRGELVPWGEAAPASDLEEGPHPTRLASGELPGDVQPLRVLHRIEAVEWWRGPAVRVDHVAAWSESAQAVAWVEIDLGTGARRLRGWVE
jgi:hypothetical protein